MIIKNIFKRIEVHPFFYVTSFFALITGNFKSFSLFMSILLFHEFGHMSAAFYFKWHIEKIKVYPFGALTVLSDSLNKPIKEEFWIVIMGPIFQCIFYEIFKNFVDITSMHYGLLCFNLLPIVPLDGSKLVLLLYQRFFSYWSSFYYRLISSLFCLIVLLFKESYSLLFFLILLTLIIEIMTEFKMKNIHFQKFLLERVLNHFQFPRRKIIIGEHPKKMKRDTKHLFYVKNNYITEDYYLQKMFDFKGKAW